ncbi:thioredoxin domain-containing protein [Solicola gregarius]|uniref:Thioredoxin domain-containing protein n=2 Tax=Solicola gregarius TaxID=2908642 RepID=A0AA46YN12_9ACTN|nr:thioredoxin domain-containing protein [Solicola gregarius]UYM06268.1 thioredoxin domain-containing protein [Solicola gregarius]
MANRLAGSTSPYLQQHAGQPVDWWEWGPEALAEAKRRDAPILLSVGYAACHWCHVMAHESFEDPDTAAYLNEHFVAVKVDREERPDVDAVYMGATQAMTGQGGWPMTCVLTPAGEPFFAGTYFPGEARQGMPAFRQVLEALVDAWRTKREQIATIGAEVVGHLRATGSVASQPLGEDELDASVRTLATQYDAEAGGFAGSPKFPPSMVLEFLLRYAARTGSSDALAMVEHTAESMARGGMYDQLGGGFARYSVDRYWRVPHFEKMLYDNALLLRLYLHWWRQTGSPLAERVVRETAEFLLAELLTDEGGFASALDADTDGVEGAYYVWTRAQLVDVLGEDDGAWAASLLEVTDAGTFEHGTSTLQLLTDPDDQGRWATVRERLHKARSERTKPARDDKVVAAWNGLAITALAEAGVLLDERAWCDAAVRAAELLATVHTPAPGRLVRTSRNGRASHNAGVLDDYGCVAEAYVAVLGVTGDAAWLRRAEELLSTVLEQFADGDGFYDSAADADPLVARPRDPGDNASPSGTSAAAAALVACGAVTGESRWRDAAEAAVRAAGSVATQAPRFAGWTLSVAEAQLAGPVEIAVVGPPGDEREPLHRAALSTTSPGAVVVAGEQGTEVPLFESRVLVDGRAAAYVCRNFVCERPVTDPSALTV